MDSDLLVSAAEAGRAAVRAAARAFATAREALAAAEASHAAAEAAAVAAFAGQGGGPCAYTSLGEQLVDVLADVAVAGFAAELSGCRFLCNETFEVREEGADAWVLKTQLEGQCGASAARAAQRTDALLPGWFYPIGSTTQLIRASARGEDARVRVLLALGAAPNCVDLGNIPPRCSYGQEGRSALHWAIEHGGERVIDALLSTPVFAARIIDVPRGDGRTCIVRAIELNREHLVRRLLASGAAPDGNTWGPSALEAACSAGNENLSAILIDAGADVNRPDIMYGSALMIAAYSAHDSLAKLLLDRGAKVNHVDRNGRTALSESCMGEDSAKRRSLISLLLERGASVNGPPLTSLTDHDAARQNEVALIRAAGRGSDEIVRLLLRAGANVDIRQRDGRTALIVAARRLNGSSTVRVLLDHGATAGMKASDGTTALIEACRAGNLDVIRMLLDTAGGCRLDEQDHGGRTALMFSTLGNYYSSHGAPSDVVVPLLIAAKARLDLQDHDGMTAEDYANRAGPSRAAVAAMLHAVRAAEAAGPLAPARPLSAMLLVPVDGMEVAVRISVGDTVAAEANNTIVDGFEVICLRFLESLCARPCTDAEAAAEPQSDADALAALTVAGDDPAVSSYAGEPLLAKGIVFDAGALEARGARSELVSFMRARHGQRIGNRTWMRYSRDAIELRAAWATFLARRRDFVYCGHATVICDAASPVRPLHLVFHGFNVHHSDSFMKDGYQLEKSYENALSFFAFAFPRASRVYSRFAASDRLPAESLQSLATTLRGLGSAVGGITFDCDYSSREVRAATGTGGAITTYKVDVVIGSSHAEHEPATPFWRLLTSVTRSQDGRRLSTNAELSEYTPPPQSSGY